MNPGDVGKTMLRVRNLNIHTFEEDIRKHFEVYGALTRIFTKKQVAFIEYATHEESAKAQAATHNSELNGSVMMVEFSG